MKYLIPKSMIAISVVAVTLGLTACGGEKVVNTGIAPATLTDNMFAIMKADRTTYTKLIIQRLAKKEKVIKASEHWEDEKALVLPAQMFRHASEIIGEQDLGFTYSLQSIWPINKQNAPKTPMEKQGLEYLNENPGENFYGEESLGGTTYFTAVYPDVAVADACVSCHNDHKDTPKTDFKIGDTMGGVVIRVALNK